MKRYSRICPYPKEAAFVLRHMLGICACTSAATPNAAKERRCWRHSKFDFVLLSRGHSATMVQNHQQEPYPAPSLDICPWSWHCRLWHTKKPGKCTEKRWFTNGWQVFWKIYTAFPYQSIFAHDGLQDERQQRQAYSCDSRVDAV